MSSVSDGCDCVSSVSDDCDCMSSVSDGVIACQVLVMV